MPRKTILIQIFISSVSLLVPLNLVAQDPGNKPTTPSPVPSLASQNDTLKSPEIDSSGRVTFRLYAPLAREVKIQAEGNEATKGMTTEDLAKGRGGYSMAQNANGVWAFTLGPISAGVYRYSFVVDGVSTTDPRNPVSSESLNSVRSMYEVPGAPFLEYKTDVAHGAIASVLYVSSATPSGGHSLRRMHIYTPPGYESGAMRYPVLYLLHGGGDTDDSWPTVGRAGAILDNLIGQRQAVPMIVVMPAGHVSRDFQLRTGQNTMGHDEFNEDMTGSVIPYVDQHYRTIAERNGRALAGLSMGGLQTLTLSLTKSELFSQIGVFSSGWFEQMRDQVEKTDLAHYKASGKPFTLYWVGVGKLDIANANSGASVQLLQKYGIKPVTYESEGFHAWNNWRDYLHIFAAQLFR